ncbi:MAG: hypothetical protein AVDCRST_MAG70-578, partial [uncultured Thermomicrobiales bacterium]
DDRPLVDVGRRPDRDHVLGCLPDPVPPAWPWHDHRGDQRSAVADSQASHPPSSRTPGTGRTLGDAGRD